jgi:hypothetical protein
VIAFLFALLCLTTAHPLQAQWTEPVLFPLEHGNAIQGPWISNDNLRMYAAFSGFIFVAERAAVDSPWTPFHNVNNHVNGASRQESPCESPSGDTLYFMAEGRDPSYGSYDIYYTVKTDTGWWGPIINCGPNINSPWMEWTVGISRDGSKLIVCTDRIPGGVLFLYFSQKQADSSWGPLVSFGPGVNNWDLYGTSEHGSLLPDNTKLVFFGYGGPRNGDINISEYRDGAWQPAYYIPEPVTTLQWLESDPCFGPDGRTLYFLSNRDSHPYGLQMYVTEDTTVTSVGPEPVRFPNSVKPALFCRMEGPTLSLTIIGPHEAGLFRIDVFNILGRSVRSGSVEMRFTESALHGDISLDALPTGTYVVSLKHRQLRVSGKFTLMR